MPIPLTGPVSLADIQTEYGGVSPTAITEYYRGGIYVTSATSTASIPTSGTISFSNFRGTSKPTSPPPTSPPPTSPPPTSPPPVSPPPPPVGTRGFSYLGKGGATTGSTTTFSIGTASTSRWIIAAMADFVNGDRPTPAAPLVNGVAMSVKERGNLDTSDEDHAWGFFYINVPTGTSAVITNTDSNPDTYAYFLVNGVTNFNSQSAIVGQAVGGSVVSSPNYSLNYTISNRANGSLVAVGVTNFDVDLRIQVQNSDGTWSDITSVSGTGNIQGTEQVIAYDATINDSSENYRFKRSSAGTDLQVAKIMHWIYG